MKTKKYKSKIIEDKLTYCEYKKIRKAKELVFEVVKKHDLVCECALCDAWTKLLHVQLKNIK